MADLKNLTHGSGGGTKFLGFDQVQFIASASNQGDNQVAIRSPPTTLHLENLNNAVLG